jgi:hypothetical protein
MREVVDRSAHLRARCVGGNGEVGCEEEGEEGPTGVVPVEVKRDGGDEYCEVLQPEEPCWKARRHRPRF